MLLNKYSSVQNVTKIQEKQTTKMTFYGDETTSRSSEMKINLHAN